MLMPGPAPPNDSRRRGFGIASRLPRERRPPELIAGPALSHRTGTAPAAQHFTGGCPVAHRGRRRLPSFLGREILEELRDNFVDHALDGAGTGVVASWALPRQTTFRLEASIMSRTSVPKLR